jgi:hypothetical protein
VLEEALAVRRASAPPAAVASALTRLGVVASQQGDLPAADALLREGLAIRRAVGDAPELVLSLDAVARDAIGRGRPARALRLLAAADTARADLGISLDPIDQREFRQTMAEARAGLEEADFAANWAAGCELTLAQAVAFAQDGADEAAPAAAPVQGQGPARPARSRLATAEGPARTPARERRARPFRAVRRTGVDVR